MNERSAEQLFSMAKLIKKKQSFSEQAVRDGICQAVLNVLRVQGLDKLTMQRVAKEADIATGTLYNYFKDKDALLVYAAEALFARIRELMRHAMEENVDPRTKLLEMIRSGFTFFNENNSFFQYLDTAQIYGKMSLSVKENHVMQVRGMFSQVLRAGIETKVFKAVDVEVTSDLIQRAIVGTICIKPELGVFDPDKEAKLLAAMFWKFLE
jgi:AcrR family transcriptional regulator